MRQIKSGIAIWSLISKGPNSLFSCRDIEGVMKMRIRANAFDRRGAV